MSKHNKTKKLRIGRFIFFLFTSLFLLLCLGIFILLAINIKDLPKWDETSLLASNSTLIYDNNQNLVAKLGTENRINISISEIPEEVKNVFITSEDIRFYQHHGVDIKGILRALYVNIGTNNMTQGGSTITQQLVRSSLLTQEKELNRKIKEAILALQVEKYYSKEEILEMYLNKIYFGEGAYGIQAAAETYFGKNANELTIPDAALLASIVRAPSLYSPFQDPEGAVKRRNVIISQMERYDFITSEETKAYEESYLNLSNTPNTSMPYSYPYFIDYVIEELIEEYGADAVYSKGLTVYTTLDPNIQSIAEEVMADDSNFPYNYSSEQPEGAAVVLDPHSGYIKAIVGGRSHDSVLGWNRATSKPGRQPGSTFKPIIAYGPAIEYNQLSPSTVINDSPVTYGNYTPKNSSGTYMGNVTLRTAITYSINTVAVKLLMDYVTIPKAIEFASNLGINIDPATVGPSLALGSKEVTPLQLAAAYGAFANDGIYIEPTAITKVITNEGIVKKYSKKEVQAMKESTAYLVTDMLKSAVNNGTGTRARISGRQVAGKTGTTDLGKDIWFAGYTPELVATVWIGYDTPKAMNTSYGGSYNAPIWKKIISQALEGQESSEFAKPNTIVSATVDRSSGLLPGTNTPSQNLITDYFAEGTIPTQVDNSYIMIEVCAESGLLPTEHCTNKITRIVKRGSITSYCHIHQSQGYHDYDDN